MTQSHPDRDDHLLGRHLLQGVPQPALCLHVVASRLSVLRMQFTAGSHLYSLSLLQQNFGRPGITMYYLCTEIPLALRQPALCVHLPSRREGTQCNLPSGRSVIAGFTGVIFCPPGSISLDSCTLGVSGGSFGCGSDTPACCASDGCQANSDLNCASDQQPACCPSQ